MISIKKPKLNLIEMMNKQLIFAPCIWDCLSANAAAYCGYKALLLSGAAVSWAYCGMPDVGMCTAEELIGVCDRITDITNLPVIVDADEGYGDSPLNVYRTCLRLAKAGAAAITIDDGTGIRGTERVVYKNGFESGCVSREEYLGKIRAALAALEGTDCVLIARTVSKMRYGLDEAIERVAIACEMGAAMPLIIGMRGMEEAKKVNARIPGLKMYPDLLSEKGVSDCSLEDLQAMKYNLITFHALEKGALYGMIDYGKHNLENKSTVYSDDHDMGGLNLYSWIDCLKLVVPDCADLMEFERQCEPRVDKVNYIGDKLKWG